MQLRLFFIGESAKIAFYHENYKDPQRRRAHFSRFLKENKKRIFQEHLQTYKSDFLSFQKKFLGSLGDHFISEYRSWMLAGNVKPDLKVKTIERKQRLGSASASTPLVLSGKMINSLIYEVRE